MWVCLNCKNENRDKDDICAFCGTSKDLIQPDMLVAEEGRRRQTEQSIDLLDLGMEQTPYKTQEQPAPKTSEMDTDILRTHSAEEPDYDESMEATVVLSNPEAFMEKDGREVIPGAVKKPKVRPEEPENANKSTNTSAGSQAFTELYEGESSSPTGESGSPAGESGSPTRESSSPAGESGSSAGESISSSANSSMTGGTTVTSNGNGSRTAETSNGPAPNGGGSIAPPETDLHKEELARKKKEQAKTIRIAMGAVAVSVIALILILVLPKNDDGRPEATTQAPPSTEATASAPTTALATEAPTTEKVTEPVTEKVTEAPKEGWVEKDGKTYYYKELNVAATGWQEYSGVWYYFNSMGVMQTGWLTENNKKYYLDERGVMAVGWLELDGKYYYFNEKGQMLTGWQEIDDATYYFRADGSNVTEEWVEGRWLEKNGRQIYEPKAEFREDEKGKWFGDDTGWFAKNQKLIIDGVEYEFDKKGYLVQ